MEFFFESTMVFLKDPRNHFLLPLIVSLSWEAFVLSRRLFKKAP